MRVRSNFLLALLLLLALPSTASSGEPSPPRPNIVMIFVDDLGLPGVSAYGSDRHSTPRIDALGTPGITFENGYAHPKCGPSRWALITGQYPFRNAVNGSGHQTLFYPRPGNVPFVEKILGDAGYATCWVGKPNGGVTVEDYWDEYVRTPNGTDFWPEQINDNGNNVPFVNDTNSSNPAARYVDYSPDYLNDYALDFIERHAGGSEPFYLYYSMNLMHVASRAEDSYQPTPHSTPIGQAVGESYPDWQERCLDDMNLYMDHLVGRVVDKLVAEGIRNDTLIVFAGDNGGNLGSTIGGRTVVGGKNSIEDGGSHVPFLVSWPGQVTTPERLETLVQLQDLLPTFAELAGATLPEAFVIDGHSFAPLLLGQPFTPRPYVYSEYEEQWFVRNLTYRLDHDGSFWDVTDAPFSKTAVNPASSPAAQAAFDELSAVLTGLDPATNNPTREWSADTEPENVYGTWKKTHWKGHRGECADVISAGWADPDEDGWLNLFEMAFGTDPNVADSSPAIGWMNGALEARHPTVSSPYVEAFAEVSEDLQVWHSGSDFFQISTEPDGSVVYEANSPTGSAQFIRLRAERTQ